jgi:hypothetical protein
MANHIHIHVGNGKTKDSATVSSEIQQLEQVLKSLRNKYGDFDKPLDDKVDRAVGLIKQAVQALK